MLCKSDSKRFDSIFLKTLSPTQLRNKNHNDHAVCYMQWQGPPPPEIRPKIQLIADETIRDYGGGGWNFNCWRWPVAQVQPSNVNCPAALQKSPRHKSQKLLPFFGWHEPVAGIAVGDGNGSCGVGGASMQLSNDVWDDASLFTYFGFGVNKLTHSSRDMLMV